MKTLLALIGAVVLVLSVLGMFGIGHFTLSYGPDKLTCTKGVDK
jgi:hypothetical protein